MTKQLTVLMILLLSSIGFSAERTVNLKKNVEVSSSVVLLKDLLISTKDLKDSEKNLVILQAPLRGFKNYRPIDIAYEMQNHPSLLNLSLIAPPFVKVIRKKDIDFVERVKAGLVKELKKNDPWKRFHIEVDFTPDDISKINQMSGAEFELISQIPHEDLISVKMSVKFTSNKKNLGTVTLEPAVRRKVFSLTLKKDLNKGTIIRKSDLVVAQVWVANQEERYCANFAECVGFELKKNLVAGSRIVKAYLADPVYVEKGKILKVYKYVGSIRVGIHAKALMQGRRGETIRVKNTKSDKILDVVMTGYNEAEYK